MIRMGTRPTGNAWAIAMLLLALAAGIRAVESPAEPTPPPAPARDESAELKSLSLEQLMDIEVVTVTSVSRRPERLSVAASAIQVVTQEDIRRSGATNLPEALRLASNLAVAQIDPHTWAISARGLNNNLADKMLVMIDGRTVYTPLYAGVFWDVQDTLLADVDRIEVISGPGATQWGANAVNGVIHVTTKNARDTQGLYVEGGGGTTVQGFEGVRYGGQLRPHLYYRVYEKVFHRDDLVEPYDRERNAQWDAGQGGFRIDYDGWGSDLLTVQGDVYKMLIEQTDGGVINAVGGNVLGRFTHRISDDSNARLQLYYDRTHRAFPNSITQDLDTVDADFQHRFLLAPRNDVVWGVGYRVFHDDIRNHPTIAILPAEVTYQVFSAFAQDEITVVRDRLFLTVGSKVEHNHYTGYEVEPSGRLAWRIDDKNTVWSAVSRAVRAPSRIDRQLFAPGTPPFTIIQGGPDFVSEKVLAYELGYRVDPDKRLSCALSTFYNVYSDVRSSEQVSPPAALPIRVGNGLEGDSYGAEATADCRLIDRVRVRLGYTAMRVRLEAKPGSTDTSNGSAESHDPKHMASLRVSLDLAPGWEMDANARAVSRIDNDDVPAYGELDLRLAWSPLQQLECALVGQNLLHDHHAEFGDTATRQEIERSGYLKIVWRY
jgi:iron complex outermembrane recepter protein